LFTHYRQTGKCEWRSGALNAFAAHYKENAGTNYSLTACLDVVRISGATRKEPEVMLTNPNTRKQMVIERKSVVWPKSYIHQHELEHEFADLIWEGAKDLFQDESYMLSVRADQFRTLTSGQIRQGGKQIGEEISCLAPDDLPVRKRSPISSSFTRVPPLGRRRRPQGNQLSHVAPMAFDGFEHEEAIAGMSSQIQAQLDSAAVKFQGYTRQIRLVLLDFTATNSGRMTCRR
jgi:hypothetical protein